MQQGVIDQQCDADTHRQRGEDEPRDALRQLGRRPGGAFEEVVKDVQAVALAVIGERLRSAVLTNALESVVAETHHPSEEQLTVNDEGGLGKYGSEGIDNIAEGGYHFPHEGISVALKRF